MKFNNLPLSTYLNKNCYQPISRGIYESVRNTDIEKTLGSVNSFLKKRGVYIIPAIEVVDLDGKNSYVVFAFSNDNHGCSFNWLRGDTASLSSICFTSDFDTLYSNMHSGIPFKWDVEVQLKGASVVRALQLVADVMKGKISMNTSALNKAVRDAQIWESCESEEMQDFITEAQDDVIKDLTRQKDNLYQRLKSWEKSGKDITDLQRQYDDLKRQLEDARFAVRQNVVMKPIEDPAIAKMQARFEEERATPEERFGDMESYILNVILGIDVSALVCGAPGVGKTFRIMQAIKKEGKVRGRDYEVIKGKCTPMVLFQMLHDYQQRGQLLIIDDADDIIKDEVSINLLKAATDFSDERIVSCGSNAKIFVPDEKLGLYSDFEQDAQGRWIYPKSFVYEGGIIIITNVNAGQIDTAIRSRTMICDLSFTTDEVLGLVRSLSPHIAPEILTPASKEKALDYLQKLADNGAPMEISIRSFMLVAKLYLSGAPAKDIERRIREQMQKIQVE